MWRNLYIAGGKGNGSATVENSWFLKKLNIELPYNSIILLQDKYPKTYSNKYMYTRL